MKDNDKLYSLIGKLNKAEKRFFSIMISGNNEQKKYELLYKTIVSQKNPSDSQTITLLKEKGVLTDYLSADKNYLYHQIVNTITFFNRKKSAGAQVRENLSIVDFLFSKELYEQCLQYIEQTKRIIEKNELQYYKLEALKVEKRILVRLNKQQNIKEIHKTETNTVKKINTITAYNTLYYNLSSIRDKYSTALSAEINKQLEDIISNKLLTNYELADTFEAKLRYYDIYTGYYFLKKNKLKEYEFTTGKINMLKNEFPEFIEEYPYEFIANYSRLLYLTYSCKPSDLNSIEHYFLNFPQSLKFPNKYVEAFVWAFYYNFKLELYIRNNEFTKLKETPTAIDAKLNFYVNEISLNLKITCYYRLTYIHFVNENYTLALDSVNKVLNEFDTEYLQDVICISMIINLIIHYELQNYFVLNNLISTTTRQLKARKILTAVDEIILSLLKNINNSVSEKEQKNFFEFALHEINNIPESKSPELGKKYFDFPAWIRSKINNKSFLEEIKTT
jgi:hypothetical protein